MPEAAAPPAAVAEEDPIPVSPPPKKKKEAKPKPELVRRKTMPTSEPEFGYINQSSMRRCARRAKAKRAGTKVHLVARKAVAEMMDEVIRHSLAFMTNMKRKTLIEEDVWHAGRHVGTPVYTTRMFAIHR